MSPMNPLHPQNALNPLNLIPVIGASLGKGFFSGGVCNIRKDLTGKVILITGGNDGIGRETTRELAKMNATIVIASRNPQKSLPVVDEIKAETRNPNLDFMKMDLADLESVKNFSEEFKAKYKKLDILINNAGVAGIVGRTLTKDGYETQFQTNYLGHFYLTNLLLDRVKDSAPSRIINVASSVHHFGQIQWDNLNGEKYYSKVQAYENTKLENVMFTRELQKRLNQGNFDVRVVAVHPGWVRTKIYGYIQEIYFWRVFFTLIKPFTYYFWKSPLEGAQTSLYCALENHDKLIPGCYYADCKPGNVSPRALNEEDSRRLWEVSENLIADRIYSGMYQNQVKPIGLNIY